jgi:hypothetical protein
MVFLAASARDTDSGIDKERASAVARKIHRTAADISAFSEVAHIYRGRFDAFVHRGATNDEASYQTEKSNLISSAISEMNSRLSPSGQARLANYVQREKSGMKMYALPDMSPNSSQASLWGRFFSLPTTHAQSMNPYGTTYTTGTLWGTNQLFATAVTDSSASCSCHQSSAKVSIHMPAAGFDATAQLQSARAS